MQVKDFPAYEANRDVLSMDLKMTVLNAAKDMAARNIGAVVVTERGMLCGIVTERDFLKRIVAQNIRAEDVCLEDIMTSNIEVVTPEDPIDKAIGMMMSGKFRHLPVVGKNGEAVSMLSQRDFVEI